MAAENKKNETIVINIYWCFHLQPHRRKFKIDYFDKKYQFSRLATDNWLKRKTDFSRLQIDSNNISKCSFKYESFFLLNFLETALLLDTKSIIFLQ